MNTNLPDRPRLDMRKETPELYAHMQGFRKILEESGVDPILSELIKVRASQINGCAYCLALHVYESRKLGISDDRLHLLNAWRDTPGFSDAERVALALTEAVTNIAVDGVPDSLYAQVREYFSAQQYLGLLATINVINAWNRFMIGVAAPPHERSLSKAST